MFCSPRKKEEEAPPKKSKSIAEKLGLKKGKKVRSSSSNWDSHL